MSVCSLEFSFPRSFLVKIYQKRFSAPFVEYSASYLNANFDLKRCAVRTINDDRLAKQCQLRTELYDLSKSASSSEGKIVVELRKLAVDVSNPVIRISLFDIIDQPFRPELSNADNETTSTIDRINFTLPHSYVLKSVKNTAGSSFHLEAWYLGQGGVVLPCMLNTTCECLDDGGGEQLTFVFDGLILNTQTRPLTMKFLSASINSQDSNSDKALKSSQSTDLTKKPSNSETVTPQQEHSVDSQQSSETGSALEGESQVTPTSYPLIASSTTPGEPTPVNVPVLQVSACPNTAMVSSEHSPKETEPPCDPSYSSLVHIEEIIANDFSTSKTNDTDSESVEKNDMIQEKPDTVTEIVEKNISASISELRKDGEMSEQKTNDTDSQRSKDSRPATGVDHDASCSVEKATDKCEDNDCLAKGHSMELVDPVSGLMTIMRVSDDEDEEEVEIVGVEDSDKSKEGQKSNKVQKKVGDDNSDIQKIVASIVESLHVDNAQKESSSVPVSNDSLRIMDSLMKSSTEFQSSADKFIGMPPVRLDMLPGVMGNVLDPSATLGQVCLPPSLNSKQDLLNKGKSSHVGEFDPEWADHFPWLTYDRSQHIMYCQICIFSKKSNIFTAGSHFFMRDPLITHTKSQQHIDALRHVQESALVGQSAQWLQMVSRCEEQIQSVMGLQKVFDYTWLIDFPWLKYDEVNHKLFCKICQKHRKKTLFAQGATLFSRRRIREHQKNKCHVEALLNENVTMESNVSGEIRSKTVMRLDANSELIFSMETLDTEKEPLHWNSIAPPEDNIKTPQKEPDMDVVSIKSEDSFQSPKLVAAGPYKVSPALSPVVMLTDVRKSPPDTPLGEGGRKLSRHTNSQSQGSRIKSKQAKDVSKKCVTTSGSEKISSSKRNRRAARPYSPSLESPPVKEQDVDADINTLLPLVMMDSVDSVPKSVAKRLSFDKQSDACLANGLSSTASSRQKRGFSVNGEKKSKEDPDNILINYLSCPADTPKKKWSENVDTSVWKPVVVLDDIAEDLSILNAPSYRRRLHCSQTKEKTVDKSKKALKRLGPSDTESVATKKSRHEDHDDDNDDDDDVLLSVRIEASKSSKNKTTRTSDLEDNKIVGFNEIKSDPGKKLMNAPESSAEVSLETCCRSSRKKGAKSPRSDTELAKPAQVTFENSYDMMEILDGLDLTDMMMCHVVLKRIAV